MLRDAVCDELTNNKVCLYDGGDCCLEAKVRTQCQDCSCRAVIEPGKLQRQFEDLAIEPLNEVPFNSNNEQQAHILDMQIVKVEEVVSSTTCAVICLDHQRGNDINAWHYQADAQVCRCGWMKSKFCPRAKALHEGNRPLQKNNDNDQMVLAHNSYIQLAKTVLCGMQF